MIKHLRYTLTLSIVFVVSWVSAIDVSISCLSYYQESPYIEIYSRVIGGTTQFLSTDEESKLLSSRVEFLVVIKDERNLSLIHI